MKRKILGAVTLICLILVGGCDRSDQQQARRKADEARAKARELGRQAEREAQALKRNVDNSVADDSQGNTAQEAGAKLHRGEQDLRVAGEQAGRKLDRATIVARVKAKLADDVGLNTVTGIEVEATEHTVTLRGTVDSAERREEAERAAAQVSGVTKVINELEVHQ